MTREIRAAAPESLRQAPQRDIGRKVGVVPEPRRIVELAAGPDRRLREGTPEDRRQLRVALDDAAGAQREHIGNARSEHDLVAKPLLRGEQQQARRRRPTVPASHGKRALRHVLRAQPQIVIRPGLREAPDEQQGERTVPAREHMRRVARNRAIVRGDRLLDATQVLQRDAVVAEKVGAIPAGADRALEKPGGAAGVQIPFQDV